MIRKLALQAYEKRRAEELAMKHSREKQEHKSNIETLNCWLKDQNVNFKALEPSIYLGDGFVLKPCGATVFVEKTCTCGEQVRSSFCSNLADVGKEITCFSPIDLIHQHHDDAGEEDDVEEEHNINNKEYKLIEAIRRTLKEIRKYEDLEEAYRPVYISPQITINF